MQQASKQTKKQSKQAQPHTSFSPIPASIKSSLIPASVKSSLTHLIKTLTLSRLNWPNVKLYLNKSFSFLARKWSSAL